MTKKIVAEVERQLNSLIPQVKRYGKTDEIEDKLDAMEKRIGLLKNDGISKEEVKRLKDLLGSVKGERGQVLT